MSTIPYDFIGPATGGSSAPATRPVTWGEAKTHLRLATDADQAYVESLIDAATDFAETRLAGTLIARSRVETFNRQQTGVPLPLPYGPLISITSVIDADGKVITDYALTKVGYSDRITVNEGYTAPLAVTYQAGYATADAIPRSIRHAILCHVGTLYESRESTTDKAKLPVPHTLEDFYRLKARAVGVA